MQNPITPAPSLAPETFKTLNTYLQAIELGNDHVCSRLEIRCEGGEFIIYGYRVCAYAYKIEPISSHNMRAIDLVELHALLVAIDVTELRPLTVKLIEVAINAVAEAVTGEHPSYHQ